MGQHGVTGWWPVISAMLAIFLFTQDYGKKTTPRPILQYKSTQVLFYFLYPTSPIEIDALKGPILEHGILIKRRGKVLITAGEESSYRVEVEGLIKLYTLLPAHIHTRHACDNEAAVKAHLTSRSHAGLGARRWAAVEYRVTLDRLHQAISSRDGRPIQVIHTHSHLEGVATPDTDLHIRRQMLAIADFQADKAHTMPTVQCAPSARELFTVHGLHGPLEKNVGHGTLKTLTARCTIALEKLPIEGALLRAHPRQTTDRVDIHTPGPSDNFPHENNPGQTVHETGETQERRHTRRWYTHRACMPQLHTTHREPLTRHRRLPPPPTPRSTACLRHQ
jgi:hypothetical protein